MSNRIILQLPKLHPAQQQVVSQARRFNVLCCGRRWGKTVLGMDRLIHTALQGKPVAWFSPSYKLLADTWRALCSILARVVHGKNEQGKRLELIGGGGIELWSLDNSDAGRSRKYALVVVDEAALLPTLQQAWQESIRPTLTDLRGSAWFLSTPKGLNYFKMLFDRGQDAEREDWASWQMPSSANPCLSPEEIDSARMDLSEAAFNQEYLALFVNWEGSVFRGVGEAATAMPRKQPEDGHDYVIGCDWGRSQDYTVFVVLDMTARSMVALDRSNRVDYAVQCGRLKALAERWRPRQILAENNSIGQPVIEQLLRDGLRVQPFVTTNASKAQAVEALALAFERGEIAILQDPVLVSELVAYQGERLPSGQLRYSAPVGQHDDCVMALAIAWSAVSGRQRAVYPVAESDFVVPPFAIPDHWERAYGLELGPVSVAAIWGARDPQSGVVYLYDEYCGSDGDATVHAAEIHRKARWTGGVTDPAANGRNELDGYQVIDLYQSLGLRLEAAPSGLVESGILAVRQLLMGGQLKVFSSLTKYREELRYYHRDESGRVVTVNDQLQNAVRYLVTSGEWRTKPVPDELKGWHRRVGVLPGTENGWMAS